MITKVNGNNYDDLFRAAERQLQLTEGTIDSIHKYLDVISSMTVRQDPNNYNLLRLPVEADEPLFEIDANTREIKVPAVFKQNGLTMQGDKLAEIVYFKMARFFDMMDLYRFANQGMQTTTNHNGAHTYIEWYNPSAKTSEYQTGVDFAYAMTCDDDYIYFGWPLADKVAGDAGTIQFTVRFLEIDNDQIIYNYSTKIASCEIKKTLNFNLSDESIAADSWESVLYSRPIYSSVINSTESPAAILLQGIESGIYDMTEDNGVWNLDLPVIATVSTAVGRDPQTGDPLAQELTFKWYRDDAALPASEYAERVTNAAAGGEYDENAIKSTFHANRVGRYTVWVGNKIADKKNIRYVYTGTATIPSPEDVVIDNSGIIEKGYVGSTTLTAGISNTVNHQNLVYTWYKGDGEEIPNSNHATFIPDDEGVYYVIVRNQRNGEITDITDASTSRLADIRVLPQRLTSLILTYSDEGKYFTATATHQYAGHKIHYAWYRIDPATAETTIVLDELTGAVSNFEPTAAGSYYVTAREVVFDEEIGALRREATVAERSTSNEIALDNSLAKISDTLPTGQTGSTGETGQTGATGATGDTTEPGE